METNKIIQGDCISEMKKLPDNCIDAIITDPPYGLEFMGKEWDKLTRNCMRPTSDADKKWNEKHDKSQLQRRMRDRPDLGALKKFPNEVQQFHNSWATECLRVLKPGGFLLSFGGTRTYHRLVCGIEDAGFEIRDTIMWLYGSGFPKSLNIGKQIDKTIGQCKYFDDFRKKLRKHIKEKKISQESIIDHIGSKVVWHWFGNSQPQIPSKENWEKLKIFLKINDKSFDDVYDKAEREVIGLREDFVARRCTKEPDSLWNKGTNFGSLEFSKKQGEITAPATPEAKEWEGWGTALKPACEPIVVARKPLSEKNVALNVLKWGTGGINIDACRIGTEDRFPANLILDSNKYGDWTRFFYVAKASKAERNDNNEVKNNHPTVKPIKLMEYLIKLVSKEDSLILDPFMGSGTTGIAAKRLNRKFIGFEKEEEYVKIANKRLSQSNLNDFKNV